MEYPFWFIPGISKSLIMACIAVLHVFVAQFAVGGGLYLFWMEKKAHALNSPILWDWLKGHTRFFLLLTMVFGGLSGVGIWFTMTVINPAGTSALIHTFLFVWAAEWTFFLVEIIALLALFSTYPFLKNGTLKASTHRMFSLIYAIAAFMSLVLINGVITFMLTPGQSLATANLLDAFFNQSYLPSLVFRTALCCMIAGMFALFTASRLSDSSLRRMVIKDSSLWICVPFFILICASFWYYAILPVDRQLIIMRRTADIRPFVIAYGWILPIVLLVGVIAFGRAQRLRRPMAVLIVCTGLVLAGSFEFIREIARRPWLTPEYMYSNGITPEEGEQAMQMGIDSVSPWMRLAGQQSVENPVLMKGEMIFSQQCSTCHAVDGPRLNIIPRLKHFAPHGIPSQLTGQGRRLEYMPPFFGDATDREALSAYLNSLRSH